MRISRLIRVAAFLTAVAPVAGHAASAAAPVAGPAAVEVSAVPIVRGTVRGTARETPRHIVPTYRIDVGLEGEVFPAFANYASLQRPDENLDMEPVVVVVPGHSYVGVRVARARTATFI